MSSQSRCEYRCRTDGKQSGTASHGCYAGCSSYCRGDSYALVHEPVLPPVTTADGIVPPLLGVFPSGVELPPDDVAPDSVFS